jgi:hypothetical protein
MEVAHLSMHACYAAARPSARPAPLTCATLAIHMETGPMRVVIAAACLALVATPAWPRINVFDTQSFVRDVVRASLSVSSCDFALNSDLILATTVGANQTFGIFSGAAYDADYDAALKEAGKGEKEFCEQIWIDYGPSGKLRSGLIRQKH